MTQNYQPLCITTTDSIQIELICQHGVEGKFIPPKRT